MSCPPTSDWTLIVRCSSSRRLQLLTAHQEPELRGAGHLVQHGLRGVPGLAGLLPGWLRLGSSGLRPTQSHHASQLLPTT